MILVNSYSDSYFNFVGIKFILLLLLVFCYLLDVWENLPNSVFTPGYLMLWRAQLSLSSNTRCYYGNSWSFLLILMSPLIEVSEFASKLILIVGSLTCILLRPQQFSKMISKNNCLFNM